MTETPTFVAPASTEGLASTPRCTLALCGTPCSCDGANASHPTEAPLDEAAQREADLSAQIKAALAKPVLTATIHIDPECEKCNYDTHRCPGCGEPVSHGTVACKACDEQDALRATVVNELGDTAADLAVAEASHETAQPVKAAKRAAHDAQVAADAAAYQAADHNAKHGGEVPSAAEAVAKLTADLAPPATAPTVNLDHLAGTIEAMRNAEYEAKRYTETAKALRAVVEHALGEREVGTVKGATAVTWKYQTSRRLDQGKLKAAHPKLVEQFTTETHSRRFLLAGE